MFLSSGCVIEDDSHCSSVINRSNHTFCPQNSSPSLYFASLLVYVQSRKGELEEEMKNRNSKELNRYEKGIEGRNHGGFGRRRR